MDKKEIYASVQQHGIYILLMLTLTLLVFYKWIPVNEYPFGEHIASYLPRATILKTSIEKYGDFLPLWTPFTMGGTPFFAKADTVSIGHQLYLLILLFPPAAAVKINFFLNIFLAGFFMYLLCIYLKLKPSFAFISSLIFMFNGFVIKIFGWGWQTTLNAYVFMPLVLLFTIKAFKNKDWLKYSIITGLLLALQVYAGPDMKVFLFTGITVGIYGLVFLVGKNPLHRLIKTGLILGVVLVLVLGLVAIKILPGKEYIDMSSRGHISWEEASKRQLKTKDIFNRLIEPIYAGMPKIQRDGGGDHIGIIAFFFVLFALYKGYKNRTVLFLATVILFAILFAKATFVFYLLWKYVPPFDSFRYADRVLVLFAFASSVLAGIGASEFFQRFNFKKFKIVYVSVVVLLLLNLTVFGYSNIPYGSKIRNIGEVTGKHDILRYMSEDNSIFRMHNYETRGIDFGTELFNVPYGLKSIYGYEGAWIVDYMNVYLSIAYNDLAKFWGILNVKYVTSQEPLNLSGFSLVKRFNNCTICYPEFDLLQKSWGPYLYQNERFLSNAYIVNHSILIVGEKADKIGQNGPNGIEDGKDYVYMLMLNRNFNPATTVIIRGKEEINSYTLDELLRYNVVLLAPGKIDQRSIILLDSYSSSGGIILPENYKDNPSLSQDKLDLILSSFNAGSTRIDDNDIIMHDFDTREIILRNHKRGFLVMSELFSTYPGWRATADGENKNILNANAIVSAIMLDGSEEKILLTYKPKSFVIGLYITLLTLFLVVAYFVYRMINRKKGRNNEFKEAQLT